MKKYLIVYLLVFFNLSAQTQINIFSENMGDVSVGTSQLSARTYTGYQNYGQGNITYNADVGSTSTIRATTPSTGAYSGASGGNYLYINGNANAFFTINNINIAGATGMNISFGVSKTTLAENGDHLQLQITVDGGAPVTFSPVLSTAAGSTKWYLVTTNVTIPTGSKMNMTFNNTTDATNSTSFRVDDIVIHSLTPLPAVFDKIQAAQFNGQLNILWMTSSETNNDHFDVEVSKNGKDFTKIATLKSKAVNGNSTTPLQYEITTPVSAIAMAAIPALLAILATGFKNRGRQVLMLIVAGLLSIFIISCQKENVVQTNAAGKIFVRVAHVDIDGTKVYSRTITAITD